MYKLEYYLKNEYKNYYFSKHFKSYNKAIKEATKTLKDNERLVIRDYLNHILAVLVYDFVGDYIKIVESDNIGRPEKTTIKARH